MKIKFLLIGIFLLCGFAGLHGQEKTRLVVLTDIGNEVDDQQSLIRVLMYANDFDIEGLIATTSVYLDNPLGYMIDNYIDDYASVYDNLLLHDNDFPTPNYLKSISANGNVGDNMSNVGSGKSSAGSNLIVDVLKKNDPRPIWFIVWGGNNTMAQALYDLSNSVSAAELDAIIEKIRVYEIAGQDNGSAWIAHNYPELKFIRAQKSWRGMSKLESSPGSFTESHGGNEEVVSPQWVDTHIQNNHGPAGSNYPDTKHFYETDSPSFLYLLSATKGLNDPEEQWQGSWGGTFKKTKSKNPFSILGNWVWEQSYLDFYMYIEDSKTWTYGSTQYNNIYCPIFRWREDFQNDFRARMDWGVKSYAEANHNPIASVNNDNSSNILNISAAAGETITLDGSGSSDPDGNNLSFKWWQYKEAGTYNGTVSINNSTSSTCNFIVPTDAQNGQEIHIILSLHDNGTPSLPDYKRVIVTVGENTGELNPPAAPSNLQSSNITETSVNLTWTDNANNEDGFIVLQSTDNNTFDQVATTGANSSGKVISGLAPGTTFFFKVYAYNGDGNSAYSNAIEVTTDEMVTTPDAPANLNASNISTSSLSLNWNDNANDEDNYTVQISNDNVSFTNEKTLSANSTSSEITGLNDNTTYYFRVFASNSAGNSGYSNTVEVTTIDGITAPAAPSELMADNITSNNATLKWSDNSNNETGFVIESSTNNSDFTIIHTTQENTTQYLAAGLEPGTDYYFRIYAQNGGGPSNYSNSLIVHTQSEMDIQLPFYGTHWQIPGKIEAEHFDEGGQSIAYHDRSTGNVYGKFRESDVDIENTSDVDEGHNIAAVEAGEWLEYSVLVDTSGYYNLQARVAALSDQRLMHVYFNGDNKKRISFDKTGGWQKWETIEHTTYLEKGEYVMKVLFDSSLINFNWINFELINAIEPKDTANFSNVRSVNGILTDFSIYPNPVIIGNDITIQFSGHLNSTYQVEIIGLDGKKYVHSTGINKNQRITIPNNLMSGMYILNVQTGNGILVKKVMVR